MICLHPKNMTSLAEDKDAHDRIGSDLDIQEVMLQTTEVSNKKQNRTCRRPDQRDRHPTDDIPLA
jgi:hypothetical protein